jgi:high-affinity nickel-transport protein
VPVHSHAHQHGDYVHTHPLGQSPEAHPHRPEQTPLGWLDRRAGGLAPYRAVRPLVVGMVHGLAGSAGVALMILATITNRLGSIFYLLVFGLGTILGMMVLTGAIAMPFAYARTRRDLLHRHLGLASGLLSLVFGAVLAYRLGFVDGLFTGAPVWEPH